MLTKEIIEKKYPKKKLEKIKHLNLWGNDLENIDIISDLKSLKIVSLSANKIKSLKPFQALEQLKELYLRNNNISNLDEIEHLKKCHNLKSLWLDENPISKNKEEYYKNIIQKLPNLEYLDNIPVINIKSELNNKIDNNENRKELETDIVNQDNSINIINNEDEKKEENENNKKSMKKENNKILDDINDLIIDNEVKNNNDNNKSSEAEKEKEIDLKITKNSLFKSDDNKLEDLLLSYDKEDKTNDKTNINDDITNNKSNALLDSKSDIFKTDYSKNEVQNINKEINSNENTPNNKDCKNEIQNLMKMSEIKKSSMVKEPNNELLNDILRNVDTSQTFIRKNNSNVIVNNNLNINNINANENKNNENNIDNSFTKNLNDMIKNANINTNISQSFKLGMNTGINNILKDVQSSQTMSKKDENEINKILKEVNSSQTFNKKKEQEIKNILKDVETTSANFNKMNNNEDINKNMNEQNVQSIDDIRKLFNNDYQNNNTNNNVSNLYGNKFVRDTRINNIFKSEMITSDSSNFYQNRASDKKKPVIPKINPNYEYDYNSQNIQNGQIDGYNYKNGQNNKYNINPKHQHTITAIINLLENLNVENLIHVRNQIYKQLESQK